MGDDSARGRVPPWRRLARAAPPLLAGVLPTALLCIGVARFVLNHFFAHAPYLLDAGWYSDIIYHAGLFPKNPRIACDYAEWYFGVHFSPMISAFSLLSYLQPLPRIEWYALHQALMFLPFGAATYALAARLQPEGLLRRLPVTVLAAFAFTFNGQVLKMIAYPHYEVAIGGLLCLLLVMLVTGRRRLAWVFLVLTLSVREDGGVHAACALAPLVYLHWRGVELLVSRRTLLAMIGVSIVSTVIGVICQKLVFTGAAVMSAVYLGDPIYSHISASVLADRVRLFLDTCQVMTYPFLATCLIAAIRRDPRYLLGWVVTLPWFVLNFLASQPQKATFEAYAGFPFVASIFWVYVYGAKLAPAHRRLRPIVLEAVFAAVCLTATIGVYRAWPVHMKILKDEMIHARWEDRAAVHGFVDALGEHRAELGRLYADYSVASIALESLRPEDGWRPGIAPADAITFHAGTVSRDHLLADLVVNELDVCTRIERTGIFVCTRERLPADRFAGLATQVVPSSFSFASSTVNPRVGVDVRGITYQPGEGIDAYLGLLPQGTYELTWTIETDKPAPADLLGVLGVERHPAMLGIEILSGSEVRASAAVPNGARKLSVRFEAKGGEALWFASRSSFPSTLFVTQARIRRVP